MHSTYKELLVAAAAVLLVAVILFAQFQPVGGVKASYKKDTIFCNGKGMINSDHTCNCYSGYRGPNCTLRYCPFGKSWAHMPVANHQRYRPNVECSNMGSCDMNTGKCSCRSGFEGRACERMSCPTSAAGSTCSGHGRCLTVAEAGLEFNGYSLVRAPVNYIGWDAEAMQGCVCDVGYHGYDCSLKSCPYGIDPITRDSPRNEIYTLVCRASGGFFNMKLLGYATPAMPYNAGPGLLKSMLEAIPGVGVVTVATTGGASLCRSSATVRTSITLETLVGSVPPRMYVVSGQSANSRESPGGKTSLVGAGLELYMATEYVLSCPVCAGCIGVIWFAYGESISDEISVTNSDEAASAAIAAAITGMSDLVDAGWENLEVDVIASGDDTTICNAGASNSFTVILKSNYGNLPQIELIGKTLTDSLYTPISELTWVSSTTQLGTPLPCSGQGHCNTTSGRCECSRLYENRKLQFEMQSSDGAGGPGSHGDCGFYKRTKTSDISSACRRHTNATSGGRSLCSGHGECLSVLSDSCTCFEGWSGILCDVAIACPKGPAWFDEPISSTVAHQLATCSNMGHCDDRTGVCKCRMGFHGAACQYMDCPRDLTTGRPCSGQGWCMNMNKWAEIAGFEYGSRQNSRLYPDTWDAFGFHACMCSAGHPSPYSLSGLSNTRYPTVGPQTLLNGLPTESPGLPGFRGWNCHERNCPSGNRIVSPSTHSAASAAFEVQRVGCKGPATAGTRFTLSFYNHLTTTITGDMTKDEIKAAIEWPPTVGNVTITFDRFNVSTACSPIYNATSGFLVTFETELGNIPELNVEYSFNATVTVAEVTPGTLTDEECGGLSSGVCDRETGTCMCHGRFRSSGGTNNIGIRGDCGYYYEGVVDTSRT